MNGEFISLPRQHSLLHYIRSIQLFGSPNGLCSSITESKHIKAIKEPWRRSSHYNALVQMLRTICRLDKLGAAWRAFAEHGMMDGTTASYTAMIHAGGEPQPRANVHGGDEDDDNGPVAGPKTLSTVELARIPGQSLFPLSSSNLITLSTARGYPNSIEALAAHIEQPRFPELLRRFLYDQLNPGADVSPDDIPLHRCPIFTG